MRMPNGYGSVIKLSGKRRRPFAVRITTGIINAGTDEEPKARQTYKYLRYFEKRSDALKYLSDYNAGVAPKDRQDTSDIPTFAECFEKWLEEKETLRGGLSASRSRGYRAAFKKLSKLHDMKVSAIHYADVQPIVSKYTGQSKSSVSQMIIVLHGISAYAYKWEYTKTDFARHLYAIGQDPQNIHSPFSDKEIEILWKHKTDTGVLFALITIYTGMRPSELLQMSIDNIHIEDRYFIAGIKTRAGIDRKIPIHHKMISIFEDLKKNGKPWEGMDLMKFRRRFWDPGMEKAGLRHLPDDGRHTCATLLEKAKVPLYRRKLILGHAIKDITENTYTHVTISDLITEIDKI